MKSAHKSSAPRIMSKGRERQTGFGALDAQVQLVREPKVLTVEYAQDVLLRIAQDLTQHGEPTSLVQRIIVHPNIRATQSLELMMVGEGKIDGLPGVKIAGVIFPFNGGSSEYLLT